MVISSLVAPSINFDLSEWKLQLPIDKSGLVGGKAAEIKQLSGYESTYFHSGSDGAMVFTASVDGATTGGSIYARSELRELDGTGNAEWTLKEGGHMEATLEVDRVPTKFDGTQGKVVIGQVHGGDGQLVRLYWDKGAIYYANDADATGDKDIYIEVLDADGRRPSASLNEKFSYTIDVHDGLLQVMVVADGKTYSSVASIHESWNDNRFYFKAGLYLGVNETQAIGSGQASFYALDVSHSDTSSPTPVPPVGGSPVEPSPPVDIPISEGADRPVTVKIYNGTNGADTIVGSSKNDLLNGGDGDDWLFGRSGNDVLTGGGGKDHFGFDKTPNLLRNQDLITDFASGEDVITLKASKFTMLRTGISEENFVNGSRALDANDHLIYDQSSGSLFYDRDGSGSHEAVLVATLDNHAALTWTSFDTF